MRSPDGLSAAVGRCGALHWRRVVLLARGRPGIARSPTLLLCVADFLPRQRELVVPPPAGAKVTCLSVHSDSYAIGTTTGAVGIVSRRTGAVTGWLTVHPAAPPAQPRRPNSPLKQQQQQQQSVRSVSCVCISGDGVYLAATDGGAVTIACMPHGKGKVRREGGHAAAVTGIAWHSGGSFLCADAAGGIVSRDPRTGVERRLRDLSCPIGRVAVSGRCIVASAPRHALSLSIPAGPLGRSPLPPAAEIGSAQRRVPRGACPAAAGTVVALRPPIAADVRLWEADAGTGRVRRTHCFPAPGEPPLGGDWGTLVAPYPGRPGVVVIWGADGVLTADIVTRPPQWRVAWRRPAEAPPITHLELDAAACGGAAAFVLHGDGSVWALPLPPAAFHPTAGEPREDAPSRRSGEAYQCVTSGDCHRVRAEPSLGAEEVAALPPGAVLWVCDAPLRSDSGLWVRVGAHGGWSLAEDLTGAVNLVPLRQLLWRKEQQRRLQEEAEEDARRRRSHLVSGLKVGEAEGRFRVQREQASGRATITARCTERTSHLTERRLSLERHNARREERDGRDGIEDAEEEERVQMRSVERRAVAELRAAAAVRRDALLTRFLSAAKEAHVHYRDAVLLRGFGERPPASREQAACASVARCVAELLAIAEAEVDCVGAAVDKAGAEPLAALFEFHLSLRVRLPHCAHGGGGGHAAAAERVVRFLRCHGALREAADPGALVRACNELCVREAPVRGQPCAPAASAPRTSPPPPPVPGPSAGREDPDCTAVVLALDCALSRTVGDEPPPRRLPLPDAYLPTPPAGGCTAAAADLSSVRSGCATPRAHGAAEAPDARRMLLALAQGDAAAAAAFRDRWQLLLWHLPHALAAAPTKAVQLCVQCYPDVRWENVVQALEEDPQAEACRILGLPPPCPGALRLCLLDYMMLLSAEQRGVCRAPGFASVYLDAVLAAVADASAADRESLPPSPLQLSPRLLLQSPQLLSPVASPTARRSADGGAVPRWGESPRRRRLRRLTNLATEVARPDGPYGLGTDTAAELFCRHQWYSGLLLLGRQQEYVQRLLHSRRFDELFDYFLYEGKDKDALCGHLLRQACALRVPPGCAPRSSADTDSAPGGERAEGTPPPAERRSGSPGGGQRSPSPVRPHPASPSPVAQVCQLLCSAVGAEQALRLMTTHLAAEMAAEGALARELKDVYLSLAPLACSEQLALRPSTEAPSASPRSATSPSLRSTSHSTARPSQPRGGVSPLRSPRPRAATARQGGSAVALPAAIQPRSTAPPCAPVPDQRPAPGKGRQQTLSASPARSRRLARDLGAAR